MKLSAVLMSEEIHLIKQLGEKFLSHNTKIPASLKKWDYYAQNFKKNYDDNLKLNIAIKSCKDFKEIDIQFLTYLELNKRTIDTAKILRKFNPNTDWSFLSHSFINSFKDWLLTEAKKKDGTNYSLNTFAQHYKLIKSSVTSAMRDGIKGANGRVFGVRIKTESTDQVFLDDIELLKIESLKLQGKEDIVRKMFLIGAYSGARISDFKTMSAINIIDDRLKYMDQKTGSKISVPLSDYVRSTLYDNIEDLGVSELSESSYVNRLIKSICKKAGINDDVLISSRVGGKIVSVLKPKYALVKSHTARKSFATNLAINGTSLIAIQKYLGHSDPKITSGYILCDSSYFN